MTSLSTRTRCCVFALASLAACADAHGSALSESAASTGAEAGVSTADGALEALAGDHDAAGGSRGPGVAATPGPFAALDCVDLWLAAERRISDWTSAVDRSCTADADCVVFAPGASCVFSCTDASASKRGEASLAPFVEELERGLCAEVTRRCPRREPVACDQMQLEPRCKQGQCSARRKGCLDDPHGLEGLPCSEPNTVCFEDASFCPYGVECREQTPGEYRWREHILLCSQR